MALHVDDLPNEVKVLCKLMALLDTDEKFNARAVCKRWRNQIDENAFFHVVIMDSNCHLVQQRFGTCRKVKSIWIYDYKREDIPIHNLTFLQRLTVRDKVNRVVVADILSRAINLDAIDLNVSHDEDSTEIRQTTGLSSYPALRNITQLCVGYNSSYLVSRSRRAWNEFLYGEMPSVQRLIVELYPNIPPLQGFDFFRLASGMPNLQEFTMKIWCRDEGRRFSRPGDVQPLTPEICRGLARLQLTKVVAMLFEKDEEAWKALLAAQCQLKKLILCNENNATSGFPVSMIRPVLRNSRGSLDTIVLDIDTIRNGNVDVQIFSNLKSLRVLVLKAWPKQESAGTVVLPNISNCSSVVSKTLEKFSIVGFKFTEEDVINFIKNMPNDKLDRIRIGPEFASDWTAFENRLEEMSIVRYGHSAKNPSRYRSSSSDATQVYIGTTLESQHDYELSIFPKGYCCSKVNEISIESMSLIMESHIMWRYA